MMSVKKNNWETGFLILVILGLVAGLILRVYSDWCFGSTHNPDNSVVQLMAKHISEGKSFPVFYYGQAYMGSLESYVGALFCRLLGVSGFAANLGTAFFGILLLPILYFWGKAAGGRIGGLAALAFCLFGPGCFFMYSTWGYGGYALIVFASAAVLYLSGRIIEAEKKTQPVSPFAYAGLGLVGGVGFWTSFLVAAALLTAAIFYVGILRRRFFSFKLLWASGGFIIGSSPLWIWNMLNHGATFDLTHSLGKTSFWTGIKIYFQKAYIMLDFPGAPVWLTVGTVLVLIIPLAGAAMALFKKPAGADTEDHPLLYLWMSLVFALFSILIFSTSHFAIHAAMRYMIPVVPALAVIFGAGVSCLYRSVSRPLGIILMVAVVGLYGRHFPEYMQQKNNDRAYLKRVESYAAFLRSNAVDSVYTPYVDLRGITWPSYAFNFITDETLCFADPRGERYPPYMTRTEMSRHLGIAHSAWDGNPDELIKASGGSMTTARVEGWTVFYNFSPPDQNVRLEPVTNWGRVVDCDNADLRSIVDGSYETSWISNMEGKTAVWFQVSFDMPVEISAVRFLCPAKGYPSRWQVETREDESLPWSPATSPLAFTPLFWSGPRPYWSADTYREECRFPARRLRQLRIHISQPDVEIIEFQAFRALPAPASRDVPLSEVIKALDERGIRRLYADRWEANRIFEETKGRIVTARETGADDDATTMPFQMTLDKNTALLVKIENASLCRNALIGRAIDQWKETPIGPWVIFDFTASETLAQCNKIQGLHWVGFACLKDRNKSWAMDRYIEAQQLHAGGQRGKALELLKSALEEYPNFQPGVKKMADWLKAEGKTDEARAFENRAGTMWTPETDAQVRFSNGVKLLGITMATNTVKRGESFPMRYYWRSPPSVRKGTIMVFVHFKKKKIGFQDDYAFLQNIDTRSQPVPEVFVSERTVRIPEAVEAGDYTVTIGLFDVASGRRIRASTPLKESHGAIILPVTVPVSSKR